MDHCAPFRTVGAKHLCATVMTYRHRGKSLRPGKRNPGVGVGDAQPLQLKRLETLTNFYAKATIGDNADVEEVCFLQYGYFATPYRSFSEGGEWK